MSRSINIALAKAKLSELADVVGGGEEIVLTRCGRPLARIVPLDVRQPRTPGIARHWGPVPDDAFDRDAEEQAWLESDWTDDFGILKPDAPIQRKPSGCFWTATRCYGG